MAELALEQKKETLKQFFKENKKAALAFSGGVDSAYLLYAAKENGCEIYPYFVKTAFQPQFELDDAQRLASQLGVTVKIIEYDILSEAKVASNDKERCYYCKRTLFGAIIAAANADGCEIVIDGTNASDDFADRPGMKALQELGVRSPLREAGLSKDEIRSLCREANLFVWDKPAYACLATRVPTGTPITTELLKKIEASEDFMADLGFSDFRVRMFHGAAKVQVTEEQFEMACSLRSEIVAGLSRYFNDVLLDLKFRK